MTLPGRHFARNLVHRRTLLLQMVRRDFEQRFIGSTAGWMWGLILPLVQLASWVFVFQVCMHQNVPPGEPTQSYPLFLFCGYLPWLLFQDTVTRSANSMVDNANLITKTVFPAEIVPVSIFLSSLASHLMVVVLVITGRGIITGHFSMWMMMLPIYMLLVGLFAIGVGWIVASLQVYLRDTAQVLAVVMVFWFWVTPIFISEQQIPQRFRFLLHLNPLASVVQAYRDRLLSYRIPSLHELAIITAYAITAFVAGGLFFRHLKRGFADVL
ncbi:MAG: ABC transporter permease [Bryobacteraceae bacterium]|jgi:ABC-type polysaccharide/polyol phosphate export permease